MLRVEPKPRLVIAIELIFVYRDVTIDAVNWSIDPIDAIRADHHNHPKDGFGSLYELNNPKI